MTNVYMDTLIYLLTEDKLSFYVPITEATAGISTKLPIDDAINLLSWSALRSADILPTKMFKYYLCRRALKFYRPDDSELTKIIYYNHFGYYTKYLINTELMMNSIDWNSKPFLTQRAFANWISKEYKTLSILLRHNDVSNKFLYHEAIRRLWYDVSVVRLIKISSQKYDTWVGWYTSVNSDITSMITTYEQLTTSARIEAYKHLAVTCFNAIFETDESVDGATNLKRIEKFILLYVTCLFSYAVTTLLILKQIVKYLNI